MSPDEVRALLARLGWSQTKAAQMVAADPRSVRRWCAGDKPVPPAAERLLLLADEIPAAREAIERMAAEAGIRPITGPVVFDGDEVVPAEFT